VCAKMGIGLALELVRIVKVLLYVTLGLLETEPQDAPFVQNGPWMMYAPSRLSGLAAGSPL
jgi:hypothetical protein